MSRIGKQPIDVPEGVTVKIKGNEIEINGPKGTLSLKFRPEIEVKTKDNQLIVSRKNEEILSRSLHGLTRTLIANLIEGVTIGFSKTLKLVGIGYRATLEGENLVLFLGFSHSVKINPPQGIKFEVEGNDTIKVSGTDKILVGQTTAKIRAARPPEPYKGKGIRYLDEIVKHKVGKAGKVGAAAGAGGGK